MIQAAAMLALYSFSFLGMEYLFDNLVPLASPGKISILSGRNAVVVAQALLLGLSALGYFSYNSLKKFHQMTKLGLAPISVLLFAIALYNQCNISFLTAAGCLVFFSFGKYYYGSYSPTRRIRIK